MAELTSQKEGDTLTVEFDEALYPKDAIYGAAYIFIDRCYVKLDRVADDKVSVRFKLKAGLDHDLDELAGEFENELLGQAWRRMITDENRQLIEQITTRALTGAAGPPGLDDLLGMDIDDDTAFDDPLGIAMSWEEKYKKGASPASATGDSPPASAEETDSDESKES